MGVSRSKQVDVLVAMSEKCSIVRIGDQVLYSDDVALISAPFWWNDNLVSFWIEDVRRSLPDHICLLAPSVVFLLSLMHEQNDVNSLLESLTTPSTSQIIVPINNHFSSLCGEATNVTTARTPGSHWSVLVASLAEAKAVHFDSLRGSPNSAAAEHVASKLGGAFELLANAPISRGEVPLQPNSYDCGPYSCSVIRQLCTSQELLQLETFRVNEPVCRSTRKDMVNLVVNEQKNQP